MSEPNIIIKVGSDAQKRTIKQEINYFIKIINKAVKGWFDAVIIPEDFEQEVRKLTSQDDYSAKRGAHLASAKFITSDYGKTLVISPWLYTEAFDTQIRFGIYFHETNHFIISLNKADFSNLSVSNKAYMDTISLFYEDYCSERYSLSLCDKLFSLSLGDELFSKKSQLYLKHLKNCYEGHLDSISDSQKFLSNIRKVLNDFKYHKDGERFLKDIYPIIEPAILSFFYISAFKKALPDIAEKSISKLSAPFNQPPSIEMVNICHESYPKDLNPDKDMNKIKRFISQFGYEFEDYPRGLFVKIVDI